MDLIREYYGMINLNQGYMDGVSITYGYPCHHIWNYVADAYETSPTPSNCPCSPAQGAEPQEFIGSNYYCESGYPSNTFTPLEVFTSDPLWDGEQCEGTCCSGTKSPPCMVQCTCSYPPSHLIELRCLFVLMSTLPTKTSSLNC